MKNSEYIKNHLESLNLSNTSSKNKIEEVASKLPKESKDRVDLLELSENFSNKKEAYKIACKFDTVFRELIPSPIWIYLGGEILLDNDNTYIKSFVKTLHKSHNNIENLKKLELKLENNQIEKLIIIESLKYASLSHEKLFNLAYKLVNKKT